MGNKTGIEWTATRHEDGTVTPGATWNPVTGCTKVSPACANCYIERQTPMRVAGRRFVKGHIPLEFHPNRLDAPLKRREPTMYFVNSMSDLFHEDVPDSFIDRVFAVMARASRHTFQVLTKRPRRMLDYLCGAQQLELSTEVVSLPLPNVWLGVSVENQRLADERIPLLLQTPAAVRFLSCEPLLGPVDLTKWYFALLTKSGRYPFSNLDVEHRTTVIELLDWVIVGGESGPRLRPTDPDWVRSIRDQCVCAGVPFFFKQWGGKTPKSGGRLLDGREWNEMPQTTGERDQPCP